MAKKKLATKIRYAKPEDITLLWVCPECKATYRQPLSEVPQNGGAVCPDCDIDCELDRAIIPD